MSELPKSNHEAPADNGSPSGLTRREWLLRLGEAAVLAGFAGIPPEHASAASLPVPPVAQSQTGSSPAAVALPPGLYDPSADHLTHVLMRDQRFVTPPPGSETEYAAPPPEPYTPAFFSADEFPVVRRLVWLTLNTSYEEPAQSQPVSEETVNEVAEWIDLVVSESRSVRQAAQSLSAQHRTLAVRYYGAEEVQQLETSDPQKTWKDGLAWLHGESSRLSNSGFLALSQAQQSNLLSRVEKSTYGPPPASQAEAPGPELYRLLKRQVIEGYYTSQVGLKELDYQGNAFHGESPGCPKK
jgi:hypothetical protein